MLKKMNKSDGFAIDDGVVDINFVFYTLLKRLNSSEVKLSGSKIDRLLAILYAHDDKDAETRVALIENSIETNFKGRSAEVILDAVNEFAIRDDFCQLFEFSLQLLVVKPFLLEKAKLAYSTSMAQEAHEHHPLSIKYDTLSSNKPYFIRVSGSLLSLLLFEKMGAGEKDFLESIDPKFVKSIQINLHDLSDRGLEANQMFMIMFNEVVNQSIKSTAGGSFEERIKEVLISAGVSKDSIKKGHDSTDSSLEYDFVFPYEGKKFGISAKRTLRERYKQFLNTSLEIDVDIMIEITLGTDVTRTRVDSITGTYGVVLLVADEVYEHPSYGYLRDNKNVFKTSELDQGLLGRLAR